MKKLFSLIYFVFSILLILFTFDGISMQEMESKLKILSFVIVIISFIIIKKKNMFKKINVDKNIIYLLIGIGIFLRIILFFLDYGSLFADYALLYNGAVDWFSGKGINEYIATFPHLIPYIVSIGSLFKVFGINYSVIIFVNIIFDLLVALLVGVFFKDKRASLIWLFNPINILWCGMCHPVIITNSLLVISILLLKKTIDYVNGDNIKKLIISTIVFSIVLSIANLFRPIMIILLIAFIIYVLFKINKTNVYKYLLVVLSCLTIYIGCNKIYFLLEQRYVDYSIATTSFGWNLYVGANVPSTGTWNIEQQSEFSMYSNEGHTPTEVQEYFFDRAVDLYKENGIVENLKLFWKKAILLVKNPAEFSCKVFNSSLLERMSEGYLNFLFFITMVSHYVLLIFNLVIAYWSIRMKNIDYTVLLQLFTIGIVSSHLFVEVAVRYSMPLFVPYILLIIINREKLFTYFSGKKV